MKNILLLIGSFFVVVILLVIVGILSHNSGYSKGYIDGLSKVSVGESCTSDADCKTPMNYILRSNCPFQSKCIENNCIVVCMAPESSGEFELQLPPCKKKSDCYCSSFYSGKDVIRCSCLNGSCGAVVSE
jgi:hypothetical protein